ncbi:MAG: DUF4340 domain-containing protein [Clostridia bacterium]|nr:DUF4340 domain-containing protein [Clostridia bacterium]
MSDFFENENDTEQEKSTVLSEPKEHLKHTKPKKKKLLPKIIAGVLCVGILAGGTFAIVKLIPKKQEDVPQSDFEEISVLNIDQKDLSYLNVKNENGTFKIYGEEEKDSESKVWYVEGIEKTLTDKSAVSSIVSTVTSLIATREITEKNDEMCGFDKSEVSVEIVKSDGKTVSLIFGNESPDGNGCYVKLSDNNKIYLVDTSLKTDLQFDNLYFALKDNMPAFAKFDGADSYFEDDKLTTFDTLTVSGKNYPKPLILVPNDDNTMSSYLGYKITSPSSRYADNVDSLISLFQNGVTVSGAYSYDTSSKPVGLYGLDNADLTLTMKILTKELIYKFKLQPDGSYSAWCNEGKLIYKVDASSIETIVNGSATSYYSPLICLYSIDDLSVFTVKTESEEYIFDIQKVNDEEADNDDKYIIKKGGKKLDCSSFKSLYQYVVSLSCYDFTVDDVNKGDKINLIFTFTDGHTVNVEFVKSSETKYQYSVNGDAMGKVSSSSLKKLLKYTQKVANGEKIGEIK